MFDCNQEPKIERCIKCPSHCECEAEADKYSMEDFENARNKIFENHRIME